MFNALGGSQPSADQQPSAPLPPGSPGVGGGSPQLPGLFQALQAQAQPQQDSPLQMGPMIASNDPVPTSMQKGQASIDQAFGNSNKPMTPEQERQARYAAIRANASAGRK